jgi:hypothetical protein
VAGALPRLAAGVNVELSSSRKSAWSFLKSNLVNCCAAVVIPLGTPEAWTELAFRKIAPNKVSYTAEGIQIQVKESASPLIYKFPSLQNISAIEVELEITGDLKPQALGFAEDSAFRIGLVGKGEKTLNRMQKLFAPAWVEKLFSLAPAGVGLDKIYFFNLGEATQQIGASRVHPKSELMSEEIVTIRRPGQNKYRLTKTLSPGLATAAIWISVDGDETKSEFATKIQKITLTTTSP